MLYFLRVAGSGPRKGTRFVLGVEDRTGPEPSSVGMLTICSCPKAFRGHVGMIQTNAVRSWTLIGPECEVLLLGDDEGTAEIARQLGARHIPQIQRNEYGTPLVNSVLLTAQAEARYPIICYTNADIILMSDFRAAVLDVARAMAGGLFLLSGERSESELSEALDLGREGWEAELRARSRPMGRRGGEDYFVFPRGLWESIPPFALGRGQWDHALIYQARAKGVPVIDGSARITAIHQKHDYAHLPGGRSWIEKGPEGERRALKLMGGAGHRFTLWDATHILTTKGIEKVPLIHPLVAKVQRLRWRLKDLAEDPPAGKLLWLSYPLILLDKLIGGCLRIARAVPFRLRRLIP